MILGIIGFIGSGKGTVANYLEKNYNFQKESFAGNLKSAISAVFGWDRELLEGDTDLSRNWRDSVDTWWAERLDMPTLTPRWVLQYWGTELCRKGFHDGIWISSLEKKLTNSTANIVVSDCRFPNELDVIRNLGGRIVWVQRGNLPSWYYTALEANRGQLAAIQELQRLKIHASETAWVGSDVDVILHNDGTKPDLYDQIKTFLID